MNRYKITAIAILITGGLVACNKPKDEICISSASVTFNVPEIMEQHQEVKIKRIVEFIQNSNIAIYDDLAKEIAKNTLYYSEKYRISTGLLLAIIQNESNFNPLVISEANAKGLMQLRYHVLDDGITNVSGHKFDVAKNIEVGCRLLVYLRKQSKNEIEMLNKYALGEGAYRKGKRVPLYVAKILKVAKEFNHGN